MRSSSCAVRLPIARHGPRSPRAAIPRKRRCWPGHGLCAFPVDPDAEPHQRPALWDPAQSAAIVIMDGDGGWWNSQAPVGIRVLREGVDGWHLVASAHGCTHRLWLRAGRDSTGMSFHLPRDAHVAARLAATQRADHWLAARPVPPGQRNALSLFQRARLDMLLALLDAQVDGVNLRGLAKIAYPALPLLNAAAWKASSERRRTHRLLAEAQAMRDGGYRRLLCEG